MISRSFNTIEISRSAIEHNYKYIQKRVSDNTPVMAMVKADGYGHGMVEVAEILSNLGCDRFGVAELREAVLLRRAGITGDIFVTLGFAADETELFFRYDLVPVVYNLESVRNLSQQAVRHGRDIAVHIKIDSGMGRLGLLPDEVKSFTEATAQFKNIRVKGFMSHFPESDDSRSPSTRNGHKRFYESCRDLKNKYGAICHIANSGAVLNFPDTQCDMVRAGIALYGYDPAGATADGSSVALQPAMSFTTKVLQVKKMSAGEGISYGHTYITEKDTKIAVLPVGYEDGYRRALSNRGRVLIRGQFAPVRGRICMNMCMVDVGCIKDVKPGDEVVLLGRQGDEVITADDLAYQVNSISYEILCNLGNNNKRKYIG